jgi:hypothetical protein
MPSVEIVISTYAKDFPWLRYCLRSLTKFGSGFEGITVHVPYRDFQAAWALAPEGVRVVHSGEEWPNRGFMWRQHEVLRMDQIAPVGADYIAHIDADSIAVENVIPEQWFSAQGRPFLRCEPYEKMGPAVEQWQQFTQACFPFPVRYETMRCYPFVYHRGLYPAVRSAIERHTGKHLADYLKGVKPGAHHPWGFTEYNALGSYALQAFPDVYTKLDVSEVPSPGTGLELFWSHGGITPATKGRLRELGLD